MIRKFWCAVLEKPERVFWAVAGFLALSFLMLLLIDVWNVFGIRERVYEPMSLSFFWFYWWGKPVEEPVQWVLLSAVVATFFATAHQARKGGNEEAFRFATLMGCGSFLMVLEDAVDVRHEVRFLIEDLSGEGSYGMFSTLFELGYFAAIGAVLVVAFLGYRKVFWGNVKARGFLVAGYVLYALAVGSSWLGSAFRSETEGIRDLYTVAGAAVTGQLFGRGEAQRVFEETNAFLASQDRHSLEFLFMDRVYEESVELLGAACLLVAALTILAQCGAGGASAKEKGAKERGAKD